MNKVIVGRFRWKKGWYVDLDNKHMRGPFKHKETAEVLLYEFQTAIPYARFKEKFSVVYEDGK